MLLFRKYTFFRIILPTFLCFRMANRDFPYYCQYFDKNLKCSFLSCIGLEYCNAAWPIWWLKQSIKLCKLNLSVIAITNTSYVYLLTCVWVFCFLKVQKYNLSPTLALNYTKATRRRIGLVSCPFYLSESWFYVWYVVGLIHVYFTIKESLLLIQAEVKKWKSN